MDREEQSLTWTPVRVRLGDLDGWEGNPKRLSRQQADRILRSLKRLGQMQTIAVSPVKPDGRRDIYDGHQRNSVWQKAYSPDLTVWALESNRFLSEQERKEVAVLTMQARASFDWDMLAQWDDVDDFFDDLDVKGWREDAKALAALLNGVSEQAREDFYTRLIAPPVYTPHLLVPPQVFELYDDTKAQALLDEIEKAGLDPALRRFLQLAAYRHVRINFQNVAEYYAHAPAEVQRLFEDSALVIVDIDRAIELGYVKLSKAILEQYETDHAFG